MIHLIIYISDELTCTGTFFVAAAVVPCGLLLLLSPTLLYIIWLLSFVLFPEHGDHLTA